MSQTRIPLPQFRTVLFAADLSEPARDAFAVACALAREGASRLIVLYVEEPIPSLEQVVGYGEMGVPIFLPRDVPAEPPTMERLRELFVPGGPVAVDYQIRKGDAADEILAMAEESSCDLLVLGTHGRSGVDRLLMGSVAEAVMRHAPCPTLTVRSGSAGAKLGAVRTVLLATDFTRYSEAALRVARGLARDHGAKLVIVHVVEPELVPGAPSETMSHVATERDALDAVRERAEGSDLKFPVDVQLRNGDPAREVLACAQEVGCDLIVTGSHGRSGLGRLLMGSVAEAVMRQAGCPVLTVKVPANGAAGREPAAVAGTANRQR
ncbi:MAG: universal stress protein [Isosphaeraceae bacterium]|nr:universal stress protein [Isosphaeraceae bacterium]